MIQVIIIIIAVAIIAIAAFAFKFPKRAAPLVAFLKQNGIAIIGWIFVWIASLFVVDYFHPRLGKVYSYYVIAFVLLTLMFYFFKSRKIKEGIKAIRWIIGIFVAWIIIQALGWVRTPANESFVAEKKQQAVDVSDVSNKKAGYSYGNPLGIPFTIAPGAKEPITLPEGSVIKYSTSERIKVSNLAGTVSFKVSTKGKTYDVQGVSTTENGEAETDNGVWVIQNLGEKEAIVVVTTIPN